MPYKHALAQLTDFQMQVCIGSLLGDMSASRPANGKNYHLSCYHAERQAEWLELKWSWLTPLSRPIQYCAYLDRRDGKTRNGARFHTVSAPCITDLAETFYQRGNKSIPANIQKTMTEPVSLACLICDDGSWDGGGIAIASKNFTLSDNRRLAKALFSNYGLDITVLNHGKYPFIRITSKSVKRAFDLCKDYAPKSLWYKFGGESYRTTLVGKVAKSCPNCGVEFVSYVSANKIYCSVKCAGNKKPSGYLTRTKTQECPICHGEYTPYIRKQKTCIPCRQKPFPHELCIVCGGSVAHRGRSCCSYHCSVIWNHRMRAIARAKAETLIEQEVES